ncbi:Methionine/alanine import family NSS transporter small subunit [Pseudomonas sp. IT-P100]
MAATRLSLAESVCPQQGKEEAPMSLTMTIIMLISGWLAVAAAMLWGVLRITRRHHHPAHPLQVAKTDKPAPRHATAH